MKLKTLFVVAILCIIPNAFAQRWIPEQMRTTSSGSKPADQVFSLGPGDRFFVSDDPGSKGFERIDGKLVMTTVAEGEPESTAVVFLADGSIGYMSAKTVKFYQDMVGMSTSNYAIQLMRALVSDVNASESILERLNLIDGNVIGSQRKYESDGLEIIATVKSGACTLSLMMRDAKFDAYKTFLKSALEIKKQPCESVIIDMNGVGGSVAAAMKIGIYIRKNKWDTTYGGWPLSSNAGNEKCLSSCSIAFLGGVQRSKGNIDNFQYHQPAKIDANGQKACIGNEEKLNVALQAYVQASLRDSSNVVYRDMISVPCTSLRSPEKVAESIIFTK